MPKALGKQLRAPHSLDVRLCGLGYTSSSCPERPLPPQNDTVRSARMPVGRMLRALDELPDAAMWANGVLHASSEGFKGVLIM